MRLASAASARTSSSCEVVAQPVAMASAHPATRLLSKIFELRTFIDISRSRLGVSYSGPKFGLAASIAYDEPSGNGLQAQLQAIAHGINVINITISRSQKESPEKFSIRRNFLKHPLVITDALRRARVRFPP